MEQTRASREANGRRHPWRMRVVAVAASTATLLLLARWAVQNTVWFGPAVADSLRFVLGRDVVESIERFVASARDSAKRALPPPREASEGYSELVVPPATTNAGGSLIETRGFRPKDVGAMDPRVAGPEDGKWRELVAPAVFVTLLHPDPSRSWSRAWVFAMDLQQLELHAAPGTVEPMSANPDAVGVRTGLVPQTDQARAVLAFNGGFKAEHGGHGMRVGQATLLPQKDHLCTIAGFSDGAVRIGTWSSLAELDQPLAWFRQTPPCMIERGSLHRGLLVEKNRNWGATLEGEVVIPRSALGLGDDGRTLLFSLSHDATPRIIAQTLQHVGATTVAQLDVNWPHPRLLVFRRDNSSQLVATSPIQHVPFDPADYVRKAHKRDFFYMTWKQDQGE